MKMHHVYSLYSCNDGKLCVSISSIKSLPLNSLNNETSAPFERICRGSNQTNIRNKVLQAKMLIARRKKEKRMKS